MPLLPLRPAGRSLSCAPAPLLARSLPEEIHEERSAWRPRSGCCSRRLPRSRRARGAPRTGLTNAAVLLGFEDGGPESGLALRGDVEFMPTRVAPNANLSLVMSLGFTHFSDSFYFAPDDYREEWSWNLFKLIPAARFSFDVAPRFGLYGDAGLGLYVGTFSFERDFRSCGYAEDYSDSELGLAMAARRRREVPRDARVRSAPSSA